MARSRQRTIVSAFNSEAPKPLCDASNRPAGPSPPKHKAAADEEASPSAVTAPPAAPAARHPTPPPLPAAAEALLLPGLDEDAPPQGTAFQMPLPAESSEAAAFGNVFADSLRVTSISRSAPSRRQSKLRQVVQVDDAEGRRLSRMPPQERAVVRARTLPLQEKRCQQQAAQRSCVAEVTGAADVPPPADSPAAAQAEAGEEAPLPPPLPVEPGATVAAPTITGRSNTEVSTGESCAQSVDVPAEGGAPVEAEAPAAGAAAAEAVQGKAAEEEEEEVEEEVAAPVTRANSSERRSCPAAEAIYAGVPADVEAAAMSGNPAPPAWLHQQGACRSEPGTRVEYNQPMAMHNQHAAAVWRSMWLSGLQWHNACRAGHPIRAGSPWAFIPLDPNEPLLELFMFHTSVMPEHVIAGAARFQDILLGDPQLHAAAMEAGVFSFGVWGVPSAGGGYSLLEGGRTLALPVTLRAAPPQTIALFLACVWHEANRAETAQHASYSFGAGGERMADERMLKYPLAELRQWVRLAVGGSKRFAEDLLAALAHLSCFGIE